MIEGIDETRVSAWLSERIDGLQQPLRFELVSGGHSNLTFKCTDQRGRALVLRRPPLGHVLESAHDMAREHRIISALAGTAVPVAPTHGLCEDPAVNGAPFYIMEFVEGLVPHDSATGDLIPRELRRGLGQDVVRILAELHKLDPDSVGLGQLGRKEAYIARQINRWTKQWEASKTHEIPEMEECCRLLQQRMPDQVGASIVHGDYRLGNMIVRDGRIQAILDWELCTLGDPLADVGYVLNSWLAPGEVPLGPGDQAPVAVGGYPSREEFCAQYAAATGRDLSHINYYRAFSHWRLAAIGQGVYKRYLVGAMGQDRGMDLERQKNGVALRARNALALLT